MVYKLDKNTFEAPNGKRMDFWYRENTNDLDFILDVFCKDKYKICSLDLKKDDVVIDLGAHIGTATLLLASMRSDLIIHAYEALRSNFDLLVKNVRENNIKSEITLNNQAVWFYEEDEVKLYYGDNSREGKIHKFNGSLFVRAKYYDCRALKVVEATNLSELFELNHITDCKFIKMDIEGSEYGVFKSAPPEILKMIERIQGEYHWIKPLSHKTLRKTLLKHTKGVYNDTTPGGEKYPAGPFIFERK